MPGRVEKQEVNSELASLADDIGCNLFASSDPQGTSLMRHAIGGLLAYSLVLEPGFAQRGTYALIPDSDHLPLRQRMVLLKRASPTATQFYNYLQGQTAREIFRKNGYGVPPVAEPR